MSYDEYDLSAWDGVNLTEIMQVCRETGKTVHPSMPRVQMLRILIGLEEPDTRRPIDGWRDGLMGFILAYWKTMQAQVTCPAKSGDPRACYGCPDARVVNCLVENKKYETQIAKWRTE